MQNKKQEAAYFDEFTSEKPWNAFTKKTYRKIVRLFLLLANPKKDDMIIDMGCGTGELAYEIYKRGHANIMGLDISKNCIAMAKEKYKGIKFEVRDVENTGLKNDSADALFYCGILHHFQHQSSLAKEARRILKKGGKIFVFEPNASNPVLWLFRNKKSPVSSKKLKTPNEEFLDLGRIKSALEKENLRAMEIGCISGISYSTDHFKKLMPFPFHYSAYFYNIFDAALNCTPLRKKRGSFIYGCFEKV